MITSTSRSAMFLQCLVVSAVAGFGYCMTAYNTFAELAFLKDQLNTNTSLTLATHGNTNSFRCVRLCKRDEKCSAVLVKEASRECQLLLGIPTLPDTVQHAGWATYRKICHLGYWEESGFCLRLYDVDLSIDDAKSTCAKDGGRLLRIQSQQEQDTVVGYLGVLGFQGSPTVAGQNSSGVWSWDDGSPIEYFGWASSSPPDNPCIKLSYSTGYSWESAYCGRVRPFLCEITV